MIPKIQFIPLGGALEVGANSYYINWDNKVSLLLDCGTKGDGPTFEGLPDFTKADSKVDYIVISHAHNDHIGGLPFAQRYFLKKNGEIITTPETAEIAAHVLMDSGKIMAVKEEKEKNPIFSKTVKSLYSEENVKNSVNRIVKLEYGKEFELKEGIKLVLFDASHVHGSACVYITDGKMSFFYTGDFNDSKTNFHKGINIPDLNVDVLLTETTNGSKRDEILSIEDKINYLGDLIKRSIRAGGRVLIPAFALGRTQEILLSIEKLKEKGVIDKGVKVYISPGLSQRLTAYYFKNYEKKPNYIILKHNSFPEKGSITVATSGFFTKESLAGKIAEEIKRDKNSIIIFPSDYAYRERSWGSWFKNYSCELESVDFSAHSSPKGIVELVKKINPSKIVLVHGNKDAAENIEREINRDGSVIIPRYNGDEYVFYKKNGEVKVYYSGENRSYLITVGTSLGDKNISSDFEAKQNSAELNTLLNIPNLQIEDAICHLVATDKSVNQAYKISAFLEEKKQMPTIIHIVDLKFEQGGLSQSMEMTEIISKISSLMIRSKDAIMVFTGGFKFEVATSYLLSNLYGVPAYYKHEDQDRQKDPALRLQSIPIEIDMNPYLPYIYQIESILRSDYEIAKKHVKNMPDNIKNIFNVSKDSVMLNNFGSVIYGLIKKIRSSYEKRMYEKCNVVMMDFMKDLCNTNYASNFYDLLRYPVSGGFFSFIFKLSTSVYVEKMVFEAVSKGNRFEKDGVITVVFDKIVGGNKAKFKIFVKDKIQNLTVFINRENVNKVKRLLNMSPGDKAEYEIDKIK